MSKTFSRISNKLPEDSGTEQRQFSEAYTIVLKWSLRMAEF